jgi:hypothetical protein
MLVSILQSVLRKLTAEDAPQISDAIMTALLQMFISNWWNSGSVMAVSTLVEVLGEGFLQYMASFKTYLLLRLQNHDEYQVRMYIRSHNINFVCRYVNLLILNLCPSLANFASSALEIKLWKMY